MKCDRRRSQAKSPAIWKSDGSVNAAYVRYLINARGRDQRGVGVPLFALNCSHVLAYFSESRERERVRDASWREQLHRRRAPNADEGPRSLSLSFSRKRTLPRLFLYSPFPPLFSLGGFTSLPFLGLRCFKHVRPLFFRSFDVGSSSGVVHNFLSLAVSALFYPRVCAWVALSVVWVWKNPQQQQPKRESRKIRRKLGKWWAQVLQLVKGVRRFKDALGEMVLQLHTLLRIT